MTNIFKILNAKLKSGNNKAIGKVRDRLEHARANAVKDRVVAKSGLFDLSVNTSCDVPAPAPAPVPAPFTCEHSQWPSGNPGGFSPPPFVPGPSRRPGESWSDFFNRGHEEVGSPVGSPVESPHAWLLSPAVSQPSTAQKHFGAVEWAVLIIQRVWRCRVATEDLENDDLAEGETWEEYHNRMRPSPRWYKPTSPASINGVSPESPKYTCTEDLEDTPFKSMNHRGETKALFEERIAADAALAKNPIFSVPTLAAALVIQRAYRAKASIGIANDPRYAVSFLARNPLIRIAAVSIQSTWRGRVVAKNIAAVAPEDRRAAASASLNIQRHWRGRVAKNTAAMLIKEQKKSTAQLAVKGRSSRKRKLAASSFKDCRKRVRNNALARDRHAKRKRTQVQNARAAKRFRDFIEYVRFSTSDTVIEDFESEVLNGGVIDDVRMDHADTYESDSE